jgi:flagellar motor protein MotB
MYFKGMRKVISTWEQERIDKKNEEAFSQAFDEIFFEEDTSFDDDDEETSSDEEEEEGWETDPDVVEEEGGYHTQEEEEEEVPSYFTTWKFNYSQFILEEIKQLQKDYQKAMDLGVDFDWYLDNIEYFDIEKPGTFYVYYDMISILEKNLFVSRYTGVSRNKRNSARVSLKNDTFFTLVLLSLVF